MSDRARALEAAILDDPEDPAAYLVYGDYLQAIGDPRGELIALQAARAADRDSRQLSVAELAVLAAHRRALLVTEAAMHHDSVDWFHGFWRALFIGRSGMLEGPALDDHAGQLLASPSARFLRDLRFVGPFTPRVLELAAPLSGTLRLLGAQIYPDGIFTDDDLRALAPLTRLRSLALSSCAALTPGGLTVLRELPELARIDLRGCALSDPVARALAALPLTDLTFFAISPALTAAGMRALATAPLRKIHLGDDGITDALIAPLAGHPTLADVDIYGAQLTELGAGALGSLPLRRLHLMSSSLSGPDVARLAPLAGRLESLGLGHCEAVTDPACDVLAAFDRLTFLELTATAITGAGLRAVSRVRSLTQLDLAFLSLDDDDVAVLAALPALRDLRLAYTRITDRAIDTLLKLPRLEKLDLGGTRITTAAIDRLATLPALVELGLEGCDEDAVARAYERPEWHVNARELLQLTDDLED